MNRRSSRSTTTRFLPTPRDRRVLEALYTHTRLTGAQIRRLFFARAFGNLAAPQTVNARLRKLVDGGFVEALVLDGGRGSGPNAYGLTPRGAGLLGATGGAARGRPGSAWHQVEVAEFRVRLEEELIVAGGQLLAWLGERELRAVGGKSRELPVPDGFCHWRLAGREGAFAVEWDRGTESLALLARKMARYELWWTRRRYRDLVPGLRLKPRLAVITTQPHARRLARHLAERRNPIGGTVAVAPRDHALSHPLGIVWWRSDAQRLDALFSI